MDPIRPEDYRFDAYLEELGKNWFAEDELLRSWLARSKLDEDARALVDGFGRNAATRYRALVDVVERPENLPYLQALDPYNQRQAEVILPAQTWQMLGEVHGSGLWQRATDERARYAVVYLLNQNGEAGVMCSVACSDGLMRALGALADDARSREVLERFERATPDAWIHGAQFVTEIQGGSDAATNELRAVPSADGLFALHGQKWFCSNLRADYWLVTGRRDDAPAGHRGISLFCVPRLWEGAPNGHTITRLKDKLGTKALPTGEIDFTGALGWPIGPLDSGLKNMIATVLTTSRIHCVLAAAAFARRAAREANAYATFRQAFGRRLSEHPLVGNALQQLGDAADRMEAGAFATVDAWQAALAKPEDAVQRLWTRILISLSKAMNTRAAPAHVYQAMMILGGNGIEERFSALPRLWRDAAIMEAWEGPYTLLLMQALEDLAKYGVGGREESFLFFGLGEHFSAEDTSELAVILKDPAAQENILRFGDLAPRLYRSFEERALAELR